MGKIHKIAIENGFILGHFLDKDLKPQNNENYAILKIYKQKFSHVLHFAKKKQ